MVDETGKRPRSSRKRDTSGHDRIVMITGVIGVIVVAISTCITAYQAYVMRGELNNTLDQQRAWIKIEAIPQMFVTYDKGALLLQTVRATNVGSAPAFNVEAGTVLWPDPGPKDRSKHSPRPHSPNCPKPSSLGSVIFPGETVELFASNPRASAADLKFLADQNNHVQIMTAICVTYHSGPGSKTQHTVASFAIMKAGDDSKLDAFREGIVPPNLQLKRMGLGDEAD